MEHHKVHLVWYLFLPSTILLIHYSMQTFLLEYIGMVKSGVLLKVKNLGRPCSIDGEEVTW